MGKVYSLGELKKAKDSKEGVTVKVYQDISQEHEFRNFFIPSLVMVSYSPTPEEDVSEVEVVSLGYIDLPSQRPVIVPGMMDCLAVLGERLTEGFYPYIFRTQFLHILNLGLNELGRDPIQYPCWVIMEAESMYPLHYDREAVLSSTPDFTSTKPRR
jgi:hypothetical protein